MGGQEGLRARLRAWRARSGWSCAQISGGMHAARSRDHVPVSTLQHFCRGARALTPQQVKLLTIFLAAWPAPGPYAAWKAELARIARAKKVNEAERIAERAQRVRAERDAYVRACLAAERRPPRSRWPAGVIPPREMLA